MSEKKYNWEETFVPKESSSTIVNIIPTSGVGMKLATAFLKAQKNIGAALKDSKNPFFKSNYADLNSVMDACKEHLNNEGISVWQPIVSDNEATYVQTILMHESGESFSSKMKLLPAKDMQALGSAISYARRYSLQSLVFMGAEDNDAEGTMSRDVKAPPVKQETKPVSSFKKQPAPAVEQPQTTLTPVQENKGEEW